jgi:hypothetical protein
MSIPTVALYASDGEIAKVWKEWSCYKKCARCDEYFNLLDSFGKWNCSQHPYGPSLRVLGGRNGFTYEETRYWECCRQMVIPLHYSNEHHIWRGFRTSMCNRTYQPKIPVIGGCLPSDHSSLIRKYDDGFRRKITTNQLSPLGGWILGNVVMYNGSPRNIVDIKWDGSMTLADIDMEISAASVTPTPDWIEDLRVKWDEENQKDTDKNPICCNITIPDSVKCKILKWDDDNDIYIQLKEIGTPLHGIAAMIPFMADVGKDDPMQRPGFKQATKEFPYITRVKLREY